jgi:hypothetical protein
MSYTEHESLVLRYLDKKPSELKSKDVDYWINEQGLKWYHHEILDYIKHGYIKELKKMNDTGKYIDFYKDKMLKVAIENEQTFMPVGRERSSGSRVKFPIKIALFKYMILRCD